MARLLLALVPFVAAVGLLAVPWSARASGPDGLPVVAPAATKNENENVGIEEKIGAQVPLDLEFRDEEEKPITLRECIVGKPTIFVPMYYRCPKLCNIILEKLLEALRDMPQYSVGKEFNVLCVSFDPKEHSALAKQKKATTLGVYGRPNAEGGWRFLTGTKPAITELMSTVGYKFEYDRTFKEYNHPSGLIILTPEGKVARYFYGIRYKGEFTEATPGNAAERAKLLPEADPDRLLPGGTTTLRLSLVEAGNGTMGSLKDRVLLSCYSFDHANGYGFQIRRAVQIGGLLTLFTMLTWMGFNLRRERRRNRLAATTAAGGTAPAPGETNHRHDGLPSGETA